MYGKKIHYVLMIATLFLLSSFSFAQSTSSTSEYGDPKNEFSAQISGIFTHDSVGNSITQHSTNAGGFLTGYRGYFTKWLGVDADYGYARNTQTNVTTTGTFAVQSNINQLTGALVAAVPMDRFKPFFLVGAGDLNFSPTNAAKTAVPGVTTQNKGTFLYGGGVDFDLARHLAIRGEYRGFVFGRPDFGLATLNSNVRTYSAQTSAGIVFRF